MTILVIGASGFLGREVTRRALAAGHRVAATHLTGPPAANGATWFPLDARSRRQVADVVAAVRPDMVITTASSKADRRSTAEAPANAALAAAEAGARLLHVSSDAVFSGAATHYAETAPPDPTTAYGAAKAAAETAVMAICPDAVIVRTSLIIGDGGSVHERRVHALATGAEAGVLFTDDVRCPVHVTDLAAALLELAASHHAGIHHAAGPDALSRYDLGILVARRDGLDLAALLFAPRAAGLPGPSDVRLACTRTRGRLRTRLRGAREFLGAAGAGRRA